MTVLHDLATTLGVAQNAPSVLALAARIHRGLPVATLDRLCSLVAPSDNAFKFRIVPKATLSRRKRQVPRLLNKTESNVVARVAGVWAVATRVLGGDEQARAFLGGPHPLLENRVPLEVVLETELGAGLVEGILGRLEHGTAA